MFTKVEKYPYDVKGIEMGHYRPYHCAISVINDYYARKPQLEKDLAICYKNNNFTNYQNQLSLIYTNIVLNTACYVEAALNYLLTFRIGEKLFNETIERNTPQQKLLMVHLLYKNEIPTEKGNEWRLFIQLFKMRNDIVHGKSEEVDERHRMTAIHELLPSLDKDITEVKAALEAFRQYSNSIQPLSRIW